MATLIDWSTVNSRIASYEQLYEYEQASLALCHVILEAFFKLSPEDVEEAITDGPNDRGVDAVFIEECGEGNIIHLFQIKCVSDFEKASNRHNYLGLRPSR
jgi:hypothetical protein